MKIIKKITAALIAGVMAVTALCAVVGAESIFDTKTTLPNGKKITISCNGGNMINDVVKNYKFKVSKSGKLSISYTTDSVQYIYISLYDSDGAALESDTAEAKSGSCRYSSWNKHTEIWWNSSSKVGTGKITFDLKKGTYYLKVECDDYNKGKFKFTPKYPTSDEGSSDAKIDALTLSVKKGTKLSFGTMITGTADLSDIKWSTSDKKVATVSSTGTVKAVAKGSATITAKIGSSSVKIIIKVTA